MRLLLLGLLSTTALFAADQALSVPNNATLTFSVPNSSPFTITGDNRLVLRVHVTTFPASGTVMVVDFGRTAIQLQAGGIVNYINRGDTMSSDGNVQSVTTSGNGADVTIRAQRFGASFPTSEASIVPGSIQMDVLDNGANAPITSWCVLTSNTFGCPIDAAFTFDAHGGYGGGGSTTAAFEVSYIKWYSTTVAPGTPISENASSATADLADFPFEGNLTNAAGTAVAITTSGTSFVTATVQSPICQLTRQYFRAGAPATLSAVAYPLNGDASITSQIWQQTAGAPLLFSSNTVASPTITGGVFGSYSFQLTVNDSTGHSRSCSVKDGFVATDVNGVITSGNASIDALIGPALRMGTSPVTWVDDRQVAEQTFQVANTTTYYGDNASAYWRIAGPGTVKVTQGLATLAGTSTTFTTTFCQGGTGSPNLAKPTAAIEVWYPVSAAIVPSGIGRRLMGIASCTDDTHLTMTGVWNPLDSSRVQPNTGAQSAPLNYNYSDDALNAVWIAQQSQAGFYDTILARYIAYYRTGIDDYLSDARQYALNLIQHKIDWGNNYIYGESRQGSDIYWSPLGIAMYALDGHPEAWPALEQFASFAYSDYSAHFPLSENSMVGGDARDMTYHILPTAAAALADPNGYASTAKANLGTFITNIGLTADLSGGTTPVYGQKGYFGDGDGGAVGSNSWVTSSSVDLTNGSTSVTCHSGTTCGFDSAWFGPVVSTTGTATSGTTYVTVPSITGIFQGQLVTGAGIPADTYVYQAISSCAGPPCVNLTQATTAPLSSTSVTFKDLRFPMGFTNNCSTPTNCPMPTNNSPFTGGVYYPTFGSGTTMTLDKPFTGTTGNYGWTVGYTKTSPGILGYGIQPYEAGMIAFALDLARQGCTSPCTGGASALTYAQSIISFIQNHGYNATLKGPYYFAGFVDQCLTSPAADLHGACFQAFNAGQARFDAGPLMRGVTNVLLASYPNSGLQSFGDYLSANEFGRPGFAVMGGQTTDSGYTSDYLNAPLGGFLTAVPGQADKGFGAALGMGNVPAFMGARLGGLTAGSTSTISLQFSLAAVPNATHVSVVDTEPYGGTATTSCSSSPCNISITTGHGVHVLTLTYLSAGGATLAQSVQSAPLITAQ